MSTIGEAVDTAVGDILAASRPAIQAVADVAVAQAQADVKAQLDGALATAANLKGLLDKADAQHVVDLKTIEEQAARIKELEGGDPPPVDVPLLVGATLRPPSSVSRPRPVWDITRVYNIDDALKVDGPVALSFGSLLGGKGWEGSASKVAALDAALDRVPDIPGQRVGDTHEFDNPSKYGTDVTSYLKGGAKFKERVDIANAGRTNPLTIFRCCMAFSLSDPSRHIDDFYLQDPENYDEFGPDVYKLPDIQKVVDTAVRYGKPLCVPEFGPLDNVAHNDPAILDEMQKGIAAWADTAEWVAWFDKKGAGADLDAYPNALAYWGSQITT